jgi:hypothetical protein
MEQSKNSTYIKSLINPKRYQAYYPDLNQTTSHKKSITLTNNIETLLSTFLLIHRPLCPNNNQLLALYVPDSVRGGYTFCQYIAPDEDLSQNYSRARIVSGMLRAISTTISPSLTFSVSGVINAADVQTLPNTRTLTYSAIPSFRRNQLDVVTTSIATGIVSLSHPESDNKFRILESNSSENTENFLLISQEWLTPSAAASNGWNFAASPWFQYNVTSGNLPSDIAGFVEIEFYVTMQNAIDSTIGIIVDTLQKDPTDWVSDSMQAYPAFSPYVGEIAPQGMFVRLARFYDAPIETISFYGPPGIDTTSFGTIRTTVKSLEYYQLGVREPATLIGVDGVVPFQTPIPGTVFTLSGVYNYEAVPDSQLARQLTTTTKRDAESIFIIPAAMNMIANQEIKFLWPLNQYDMQVDTVAERASNPENVGNASGILDIIKGLGRTILPAVSGLASTINPILGSVVQNVGESALTTGLYRGGQMGGIYRPYNPRRGYMASGNRDDSDSEGTKDYGDTDTDDEITNALDNEDPDMNTGYMKSVADSSYLQVISTFKVDTRPFDLHNITTLGYKMPDVPKIKVGKAWNSLIASSTKSNLFEAMARGVISQLDFEYLGNRFPIVAGGGNTQGIVYFSGLPFEELSYQELTYSFSENGVAFKGTLYIANGGTNVQEEAIFAICAAHAAAKYPEGFLTYDFGRLQKVNGSSVGLATFATLMRKASTALITGAILPASLDVFTPASIPEKIAYARECALPLIVPGDDDFYQEILKTQSELTPYCIGNGDLEAGDVTEKGFYPGVYVPANLAAFTLSMLFCKGDKTLAWQNVQSYTIEEIVVTDKQTGTQTTTFRPAPQTTVPVATAKLPDWPEIADEVEYIGANGFTKELLTDEALMYLSNGNLTNPKALSLYNTYETLFNSREVARQKRIDEGALDKLGTWPNVIAEYEQLLATPAKTVMNGRDTSLIRWQTYPLLGMIKAGKAYLEGGNARKSKKVAPKLVAIGRQGMISRALQGAGKQQQPQQPKPTSRRKSTKGTTHLLTGQTPPKTSTSGAGKTGPPQSMTRARSGTPQPSQPPPSYIPPPGIELFSEESPTPEQLFGNPESEEEEESPEVSEEETFVPQSRAPAAPSDPLQQMLAMMTAMNTNMNNITARLDKVESGQTQQKSSGVRTRK